MPSAGKGAILSTLASLASLIAAPELLPSARRAADGGRIGGGGDVFRGAAPWLLASRWLPGGRFRPNVSFRSAASSGSAACARTFLLWFSAVTVVTATPLAPQFTATLLAGRLPGLRASQRAADLRLSRIPREFHAASPQTRLVVLLSPT